MKNKVNNAYLKNKGIGIFDSGVGGLTVLREIRRLLPYEDIFYLGDTARVPYGNRSKDTIVKYSIQNTNFLLKLGIKLLVVACNTSSSVAIDYLKQNFSGLPIIGVIEPGSAEAIALTKNNRIGVIGTRATIESNSYKLAIHTFDNKAKIFQKACPLFVPIVEEGMHKTQFAYEIARYYLSGLKQHNIDTLILGCTHYPVLSPVIKKVVGDKVKLVNSGQAVAKRVYEYLSRTGLMKTDINTSHNNVAKYKSYGALKFYVTDAPEQFKKMGKLLLSIDIDNNVKKVILDEHG
ncbi:MAG: glutamate racemase [bacterium]